MALSLGMPNNIRCPLVAIFYSPQSAHHHNPGSAPPGVLSSPLPGPVIFAELVLPSLKRRPFSFPICFLHWRSSACRYLASDSFPVLRDPDDTENVFCVTPPR